MHKLEIKVICVFRVRFVTMAGSPIPDPIGRIAHVLLVIGGLNWGLVGLLDTNLVMKLKLSKVMRQLYKM